MSTTTTSPAAADALDHLTAALDTIPGRTRLAHALDDVQRHRAAVPEGPDPAGAADSALVALVAGDPVDLTELGADVIRLTRQAEENEAARAGLDRLAESLRGRLDRADRDGTDTALGHLDGVLRGLLDDARAALADLGPVTTPDAAIDAGVGDAWRRAVRVADQIVEVRHAQADVLEPRIGDDADAEVRLWGSVEHPERAADPDVLVDAQRRYRLESERPEPAWAGATVAALRVLVEGEAGPRVATLAQMRATASRVRGLATGAVPADRTNRVATEPATWTPPRHDDAPVEHPAPAGVMRGQMLAAGSSDGWGRRRVAGRR